MADKFARFVDQVGDPGRRAVVLTPSDMTDLPALPKSIYVGTAGDVAMIGVDDPAGAAAVVWRNVPAGATVPFRPRRVLATGTTATDMLAIL